MKKASNLTKPWDIIQLIDGLPITANVKNDLRRIGPISFKLHGDVPLDLSIMISEHHSAVTE